METLTQRLEAVMDAFPAKTALYCVDLTNGRPIAAIREDSQVVSASTIKVALLCCALQDVMEGKLSLQQFVPICHGDYCDDTEVFEPTYRQDGASLWEMLYWMIVSSDNTATNSVISLLGYDHVNDYCRKMGLCQTSLQRKMLDFQAIWEGRNNYTSAADLYRLFSMLYHGEILTQPLREVALDFLSRCRHTDALQRYIPDPVVVAHKPGGLDHLNHDAGIFLLEDRPFYLGIFTWDGPALDGEPQQNRLIGKLSRMVYDAVKGGEV
ncbi:MAG: class A beta-lactamase-related serine hydrolase [Clostridiales bacterium]|nr:class A beta-lactamase-related serine hydrolase [Clostridiales bacterium]